MKRYAPAVLLFAAATALAGDLEVADKYLRAQDYGRAFPIYAGLAQAGNAEAQFRLGEMYWYGDGTGVDMSQADAWLRRAAAKGHAGAIDTLAVLRRREARAAELAYWTTGYQAKELTTGQYACPTPKVDVVTASEAEKQALHRVVAAWEKCYDGFVAAVNSTSLPIQRIPADVLALMTPREAQAASQHIGAVVADVVKRREKEVLAFASAYKPFYGAEGKDPDTLRVEYMQFRRSTTINDRLSPGSAVMNPNPTGTAIRSVAMR